MINMPYPSSKNTTTITPVPQIAETKRKELAEDNINTPASSHNVRHLLACFTRSQKADITTRRLFRRIGKGLDTRNTKIAAHEAKVRNLELQIEDLRPKKRAKVRKNPNKRLVQVVQVEEARRQVEDQLNGTQTTGPIETHEIE
jgi:4-hydroxybenzoate polyprenyltransferase